MVIGPEGRPFGREVPDDALELRRRRRRCDRAGGSSVLESRAPSTGIRCTPSSAARVMTPARRRGTGPGILHDAAGEGQPVLDRPRQGAIPLDPDGRVHALPRQPSGERADPEASGAARLSSRLMRPRRGRTLSARAGPRVDGRTALRAPMGADLAGPRPRSPGGRDFGLGRVPALRGPQAVVAGRGREGLLRRHRRGARDARGGGAGRHSPTPYPISGAPPRGSCPHRHHRRARGRRGQKSATCSPPSPADRQATGFVGLRIESARESPRRGRRLRLDELRFE